MIRPFQFKARSRERGAAWKEIADNLSPKINELKIEQRAVRERVTFLLDRQKKKNREHLRASGIGGEETDEEKNMREVVEDLIEQEEDYVIVNKGEEEKRKQGVEMRKRAVETLGETKQR